VTGGLALAADALDRADLQARRGRVRDLIGLVVEATGLQAHIGELCHLHPTSTHLRGRDPLPAEVVGFRDGATLLMPLGQLDGIGPGHHGQRHRHDAARRRRRRLLGRVVDGLGRPIDGWASWATSRRARPPPIRPTRSPARASRTASRSASARSTRSSRAARASAWASSPAPASASRRCWG
jgi:flagellum-specific ATP synthase